MGNEYLGLSLFIMLLSFFLILNSMSTFKQDKTAAVVSSLNSAFGPASEENQIAPALELPMETSFKKGDALDDVEGLFNAQIKPFRLVRNRLGTEMHVRMSLADFQEMMNDLGKTQVTEMNMQDAQGGAFLPTLVSILQTAEAQKPYHMDMTINTGISPSIMRNQNPEALRAYAETIADFAQKLESAGLTKKILSTGISGGPENTVELYFRRYQPFQISDNAALKPQGAN